MKFIRKYKIPALGLLLVLAGLAALFLGFYGHELSPQVPSQPVSKIHDTTTKPVTVPQVVTKEVAASKSAGTDEPVAVWLPDVSIDVSVINGYYSRATDTWTLSNHSAQFAVMTSKPNIAGGNTFIYGHNRSSVFGRLPKIKSGNLAYVTTDAGLVYVYKYRSSYTVSPNDPSVLSYQGAPILTLQTCTGIAYQNRTMYVFDLVGVRHA